MDMWADFYDEVRSAILAAWPEVATNGIFETSELQRISGERTRLPLAILHKLEVPKDAEIRPLGFQTYAPVIAIHYLGKASLGEDGMRERLQTLAVYLLTTEMTEGRAQVISVEALDSSDEAGGNQVLITKNVTASAGTVLVRLLVGHDVHH